MKRITKTAGALSLVGLAAMSCASAATDDSFWYVGANVGQSRARIDDARITATLLGAGLITTSIMHEDRNTAFKLLGGYQFNKHFALEAGYFDLGQFGYTATTVPAGTLTGKVKLKGGSLDLVGMLPMTEKFSAFGRVGVNYAQAQDTFANTGVVPVPANASPSKNEINYKFGAGLQYDFTQSLGMRVEAERYRINDAVGSKGDIDMYSLGLVYRFDQHKPAPVEKVVMQEPVVTPPAPEPQVVVVVMPPPPPKKVVFSADSGADALFTFGKSVVTPTGQRALDKFASDLKGAQYEVITVIGHTDRLGPNAYNMKLSERRANAVRDYLVVSAGIPADKITAKGMGKSEPLTKLGECKGGKATKKLVACLAPDRRVEVDVVATRTAK